MVRAPVDVCDVVTPKCALCADSITAYSAHVVVSCACSSEVVEYEKSHNATVAVPEGYFEQACAAERAAVETPSVVTAAAVGKEASLQSNLTVHESIAGRKDRQASCACCISRLTSVSPH